MAGVPRNDERAEPSLPSGWRAMVAGGVDYFRSVVDVLQEVDLVDVPPAFGLGEGVDVSR